MLKLDFKIAKESFQWVLEQVMVLESLHNWRGNKVVITIRAHLFLNIKTLPLSIITIWFLCIQTALWKLHKETEWVVKQEISQLRIQPSNFSVTVRILILRKLIAVQWTLEWIKVYNSIKNQKMGSMWFLQSQ